ncbi:hypothetical protein TNCV_4728971 [Trichonephila clavipes]|nr:hypothetical protein TNCV_4728971 [Trichonephila clavipes]
MGICDLSIEEDETDQAIEEPDERIHINRDSETATVENPVSQRYDVENGKSIRNAFVFSSENSSSTSAQN